MVYDPNWVGISPILSQAIKNDSIIAQTETLRLDVTDWGLKLGQTELDPNQDDASAFSLTPLKNNKMFVTWGVGVAGQGRFIIINSDGVADSTSYEYFETSGYIDRRDAIDTSLLSNGNVVIAYAKDLGAQNSVGFKIYDENGDMVRDYVVTKASLLESSWSVSVAGLPDGKFALVWEEGDSNISYFSIYDNDGDIIKSNIYLGEVRQYPKIAPLANGNIIISYFNGVSMYYRIYDRNGNIIQSDTLLITGLGGLDQAWGMITNVNSQVIVPYAGGGVSILDVNGNIISAFTHSAENLACDILPNGNIVVMGSVLNSLNYNIYDSLGNLVKNGGGYATAISQVTTVRTRVFKDGTIFFGYFTDPSTKVFRYHLYHGTEATFDEDLKVSGLFSLATGTTVNDISTDTTLSGDSNDSLITEHAAKTYVDTQITIVTNSDRIFAGNSSVRVYNDALDSTSHVTVTLDDSMVATFYKDGLQLLGGATVQQFSSDLELGGYNGNVGELDIVPNQFAVRQFIEGLASAQSEPTGFEYGNSNAVTLIGIDGSNSVYIEPTSGFYDIFFAGVRYRKTLKESVTISDVEGLHFIYFDNADAVLKETTTFNITLLYSEVYVAVVYWDATNKEIVYFGDERHGCTMDGKTHINIHLYRGTLYFSGLALGDITPDSTGTLDIEAQFSVANGQITDEDISHVIPNHAFPANMPMFYLDGPANWRYQAANNFPLINTGSGRMAWNQNTGGTWSLTEATDNYYVLTHVFACNDPTKPVVGIVGQAQYSSIAAARAGATDEINSLVEGELPFAEFIAIGTVIYQTSDSFTNTPKASIRTNDEGADYTDWRTSGLSPGSGSVTDHGSLSGLGNDDHLQYVRVDGTRAITGNFSINAYLTLNLGTNVNEFSTDGTLAGNSDDAVPTEQAVKTYVDTQISPFETTFVFVSSDSTAQNGDIVIVDTGGGPVTITMIPSPNARIAVKKMTVDANDVTIDSTSGLIDNAGFATIDTAYQAFTFVSDGTDFYVL